MTELTAPLPKTVAKAAPATGWWTPRLAGPVIAAAVVRFGLLAAALVRVGSDSLSKADTAGYLIPGRNLLMHGRFVADGVPDLLRTPGYSLFLALTSLPGAPVAAAANVILSVVSVILVWRLGKAVFGDDRIAIAGAWIFAFEPTSIASSVALLAETLFVALLLLSMERFVVFLRHRRLCALAISGLSLAAATFAKPVVYYLPLALVVGLVVVFARVPGLRWKAPAVLLVSLVPWLAAWQIRNRVETGYGGFCSISEVNLYFYEAGDVLAKAEHKDFSAVLQGLGYTSFVGNSGQQYLEDGYTAVHPEQVNWSQAQRLAFIRASAIHIVRSHFGTYLRSTCLANLSNMLFSPGAQSFDRLLVRAKSAPNNSFADLGSMRWALQLAHTHPARTTAELILALVLAGLYLLAARGIMHLDLRDAGLWLLLGVAIYFCAVYAVAGTVTPDARFRLPLMPILCLLAAAGIIMPRREKHGLNPPSES